VVEKLGERGEHRCTGDLRSGMAVFFDVAALANSSGNNGFASSLVTHTPTPW
jgi:hypothetical protein